MKKKVFNALCIATSNPYNRKFLWYDVPAITRAVSFAVKMGWASRWSTTQVEWREAGILEARKAGFC